MRSQQSLDHTLRNPGLDKGSLPLAVLILQDSVIVLIAYFYIVFPSFFTGQIRHQTCPLSYQKGKEIAKVSLRSVFSVNSTDDLRQSREHLLFKTAVRWGYLLPCRLTFPIFFCNSNRLHKPQLFFQVFSSKRFKLLSAR